MPLQTKPVCKLRVIGQRKQTGGCTVIEYEGDDGNLYHQFVALDGSSVWLITKRQQVRSR